MIRLVHQFDDPRTRASVASPKSCGCSCCCCCVATLVGSSVLTARAVGVGFKPRPSGAADMQPAGPSGESPFRAPVEVPVPNLRTIPKRSWKILGFFLLPLALLLSCAGATFLGGWAFPLFLLLYVGGLFLLRDRAGLRGFVFVALLMGIPIATVVEAIIWATTILK
jgi:hypothetical protein